MPRTAKAFSMQPVPENYNTLFLYNLGIHPDVRGLRCFRMLFFGAMDRGKADGCVQGIAETPVPSYAGSEHVAANPAVRAAIDACVCGGPLPTIAQLRADPHLALYLRLSKAEPVAVYAGFLPADTASGGNRVMLYRTLTDWPGDYSGRSPGAAEAVT
jgi:hypothetical protein